MWNVVADWKAGAKDRLGISLVGPCDVGSNSFATRRAAERDLVTALEHPHPLLENYRVETDETLKPLYATSREFRRTAQIAAGLRKAT